MNWIGDINKEVETALETESEIHSFVDYMKIYQKNPRLHTRASYDYLIDMFNYYGKTDEHRFKLFKSSHPDSPAVHGQVEAQKQIYQNLINFKEEGFNNKFLLLVGPNGSSKSSIVKKIMRGAEDYSHTSEGALYSFSWIFPIDNFVKGTLGLTGHNTNSDIGSFAYLEDKDILAILPSELKDHPLLLIPKKYRQKFLEDHLKEAPEHLESVKNSYFYNGDLSKRNRMIYDALLKNYKGKVNDVLKHIRIERFTISKRYSSGAVTIEPQLHVDARMQQITMDKRLGSLPPSLQSLNLFSLQGEVVLANRGILEYSDLLKRPLDTYKYLLQTMESTSINLNGILTELDIFFIGTSNEVHLAAFKQHPDFNSFKGRFNFIRVPYLLNYKDETKIYEDQIKGLKDRTIFEPHSLTTLCMFAIMTRIRMPEVKNFEDKKLANIATNLNPLEKIQILAGEELNDLDIESAQILKSGLKQIENEFSYDNLYEGKFGISPRDMKHIIYRLSSLHNNVTFVEVLEYLTRFISKKNDYDFLNMTPQSDYHHPARFLTLIKEHALDRFDIEVRDSLGLIDDRSYEDYIKKYIENINALIKKEKVKNSITGKFENVDAYSISEFEKAINLKESADIFRSTLLSNLGAYALDHRGKPIVYKEVFPDLVNRLKESFRIEQKKVIENVAKNIVYFEAEIQKKQHDEHSKKTPLSEAHRLQIKEILQNLQKNHGYSFEGAMNLLKTLIKERY